MIDPQIISRSVFKLLCADRIMGACFTKARRRSPSSPWPDLPPKVAGLILCRLSSYADRLSFRAVCHQWRIAAQQQRPVLPPALPWLHQRMDTYQSLPDGKVHRFAVPRAPCNSSGRDAFDGMLCNFGSWVLYEHHHDEDHTYRRRCLLRNPFSGATIHIPWRSIDGRERPLMEFIFKLIVCSSELVAALVFAPSGVAFFRPGAGFSWSFSPADDSYTTYKDIAFFHGNLYALNGRGGLFLHHHDSGGQVEHVIKTPPPATKFSELPDDCRSFIQHLVVSSSSGKLLMVRWGIDPPNYGVKKTAIDHGIRLDVFEADFEKKQWSEVKDLGDQVLFVGRTGSRSICSSHYDERFRGNRVFILGLEWNQTANHAHGSSMYNYNHVTPSYLVYDVKSGDRKSVGRERVSQLV